MLSWLTSASEQPSPVDGASLFYQLCTSLHCYQQLMEVAYLLMFSTKNNMVWFGSSQDASGCCGESLGSHIMAQSIMNNKLITYDRIILHYLHETLIYLHKLRSVAYLLVAAKCIYMNWSVMKYSASLCHPTTKVTCFWLTTHFQSKTSYSIFINFCIGFMNVPLHKGKSCKTECNDFLGRHVPRKVLGRVPTERIMEETEEKLSKE